jgi:hypothetical protein
VTDELRLGGAIGEEEWSFDAAVPVRSVRGDLRVEVARAPDWSATVDAGYRQYDTGVKGQFLLDARLRYKPAGEFEAEVFAIREDFSKNGTVFFEDLYLARGGFGVLYRVSNRLELDGAGSVGALTDGNGLYSADARLRYLLTEGTGRLHGHYRLHLEGFHEESPAYFSPDRFTLHGLGLLWRLDWGESGGPKPYLEAGYEISFDSGANISHNFQLGHRYRLAKAVDLGLDAKLQLGDVYEEKRGELFMTVAF